MAQRHGVGEHLVARCQARYVLADRGDHTRRLDAERQRRLAADVPVACPDELVPAGDPAAWTEITTSSGAGDAGAASSSVCTWPPNASTPAACIRRITTTCGDRRLDAGSRSSMLLVPMLRKAL